MLYTTDLYMQSQDSLTLSASWLATFFVFVALLAGLVFEQLSRRRFKSSRTMAWHGARWAEQGSSRLEMLARAAKVFDHDSEVIRLSRHNLATISQGGTTKMVQVWLEVAPR
jgi:hypothetical protein